MACPLCWVPSPQAPGRHSYLIELTDDKTGRWGRCVFQSDCPHGMQEWAEYLASRSDLWVHDERDERFLMLHPRVVHVDALAAAHLPIVDPTGCGN